MPPEDGFGGSVTPGRDVPSAVGMVSVEEEGGTEVLPLSDVEGVSEVDDEDAEEDTEEVSVRVASFVGCREISETQPSSFLPFFCFLTDDVIC